MLAWKRFDKVKVHVKVPNDGDFSFFFFYDNSTAEYKGIFSYANVNGTQREREESVRSFFRCLIFQPKILSPMCDQIAANCELHYIIKYHRL